VVNVEELLGKYNIEFVDHGTNVAKGNVNIQCPWCGEADHSQHLGINIATGMWGCWRNAKHRGRKLSRLLIKLTGLSTAEARRVCGEGTDRAMQRGDLENAVQGLTEGETAAETPAPRTIRMDPYARPLTADGRMQLRAIDYLVRERGFLRQHIGRLVQRYQINFAVSGDFADRIIFPVKEKGILQTYLGRSISRKYALRYKALAEEDSVKQVKDCLYNYDHAMKGGRVCYIVEGVFDVLKLDFYNWRSEVSSVGLFNMNVEDSQIELLYDLKKKFNRFIVLLDKGQVAESLTLESQLKFLPHIQCKFIEEAEDPGELTPAQARKYSLL